MIYRETGNFVTNYLKDRAIFSMTFDKVVVILGLLYLFLWVPTTSEYFLSAHVIPILAVGLATVGLNILTGLTGQLSLGTAGFMCVGAFGTYNLMLRVPEGLMSLPVALLLSGIAAGFVGVVFGLPAIRIKGFYLLVSTLAAQYFVWWFFNSYAWFLNYESSGVVAIAPKFYDYWGLGNLLGVDMQGYPARYLLALTICIGLSYFAKNLLRSNTGRNFMSVRDRDIAASVMGISVPRAKLLAFFISCFYCGVAGGIYSFLYIGNVDLMIYGVDRSFTILFMLIIGGLGSISGSWLGAIFVYEFPIVFTFIGDYIFQGAFNTAVVENVSNMVYGVFIIALLIREPGGFAALWGTTKQKLRMWPYPH
ncbi:branched-chain amino acid ABC transporter permease [Gammaproteobacteria bacterium]|nr:branched-chain amino acid ABC transporter permease [Gammaproteobacteria bacterium]